MLKFDSVNQHLFWVPRLLDRVIRSSIGAGWATTTKQIASFLPGETFQADSKCLDIDYNAGKLYGCTTQRVFRVNLDGSDLEFLPNSNGSLPFY